MIKLTTKQARVFIALAVSIIVLAFLLALQAVTHPAFQPAHSGTIQNSNTIQLKHYQPDCMIYGCN